MIWFLSVMSALVAMLPIVLGGFAGAFFSIDPEVMYVGNALSYIKIGQIQYFDHPGTPTILSLAFLFWPWRIYAKLIAHIPFVLWSLVNYDFIFLYSRLIFGLIFGFGVWLFLRAVYVSTKSKLAVLMAWLLLIVFSPTLRMGSGITPETVSLVIVSGWLYHLAKFLRKPDVGLLPVLGLISGLAVANKFTNLFLVPATLSLTIGLTLNARQKVVNAVIAGLAVLISFVIGTWPIRDKYTSMLGWVGKLATTTGLHAGGESAVFSLSSYQESIRTLWLQEPWLIIGSAVLIVVAFLRRRDRVLSGIVMFGIYIFGKYPLSYYQLANYLVTTFLLAHFLSRFKPLLLLVSVILTIQLTPSVTAYLGSATGAVDKSVALTNYALGHPAKKAVVWEWGRAKDPAVLWTTSPDWHGGIFADERRNLKLPLELSAIPKDRLFELCWDQLYIQKVSAINFLEKYSGRSLVYKTIPGNDEMAQISTTHCL